jgi:hypothetical protein
MKAEIRKRLNSLPKTQASFVEPMECLSVSKLPEGPEWIWEPLCGGPHKILWRPALCGPGMRFWLGGARARFPTPHNSYQSVGTEERLIKLESDCFLKVERRADSASSTPKKPH